jgi:hypothetical protein
LRGALGERPSCCQDEMHGAVAVAVVGFGLFVMLAAVDPD